MILAFSKFARSVSTKVGSATACLIAVSVVILWACTGPFFNFSDTWQLIINTGTTIITFLMVFLIQNAQNHDAKAIQLKLDELIRSIQAADNKLINIEEKPEIDLNLIEKSQK